MKIQEENPCEIELLKYTKNTTNCHYVPVNLKTLKIQKIEENKWIVLAPTQIIAHQKCGNNEDNIPLNGSYVIELNNQCEVEIGNNIIKTFKNLQPNFKQIQLPKIKLIVDLKSDINSELKPLEIKSTNLDEIKTIYSALDDQKSKLKNIDENSVYFHKTSIYTILSYVIIIFTVISFTLYECQRLRRSRPPSPTTESESPGHLRNIQLSSNSGVSP